MSRRFTIPICLPAVILLLTSLDCTLEDVYDEVRVVATVPAPQSLDTPHRITRRIKLSGDTDRVEEAHIELVRISVLNPETADLSVFLGIRLFINAGDERSMLAQTSTIATGTRSLELDIAFTGDLKPYLDAASLEVEWEVYYRSTASYPAGGIEIETILGFNADVEII